MNTDLIINLEKTIANLQDQIDQLKRRRTNLLPVYTETQRDALVNVKDGTMIINSTSGDFQIYYSNIWVSVTSL